MLRIERDCDGCSKRLRLSGRIQLDDLASIRSAMNHGPTRLCPRQILDLSEVTLVDLGVVRFLISCEDQGVDLVQCPPYVREWILRERTEGSAAREHIDVHADRQCPVMRQTYNSGSSELGSPDSHYECE